MAENKASTEGDHRQKADEKLALANSRITELEAKLTGLQQELTVLQMQDKRTPIVWDNQYGFLGSDSEPTSGRLSWKRKKGQAFLLAISYGGFFLSEASMLVLADEPMLMMLASSMQTWLMNEAVCPPAVRQEPDNTLNLLDVDFWLWY